MGGGRGVAAGFIQLAVTGLAAAGLAAAIVSLVGFTGSAWRLGEVLLRARPLAGPAETVPQPLVALAGATLIYLLAQLPAVGPIIGVVAIAYGLGSAAAAQLAHGASAAA